MFGKKWAAKPRQTKKHVWTKTGKIGPEKEITNKNMFGCPEFSSPQSFRRFYMGHASFDKVLAGPNQRKPQSILLFSYISYIKVGANQRKSQYVCSCFILWHCLNVFLALPNSAQNICTNNVEHAHFCTHPKHLVT